MMKKYIAYAVIILSISATGCATSQDIERVESKVAYTSQEISEIRTTLDEIGQIEDRQEKRDRLTFEQMEKLATDVGEMKEELAIIKRNQASLGSAVDTMAGGELVGVTGQMDELRHEVETSKLKLDAFKAALLQKLADLEQLLAEPRGSAAGALESRSIPTDGSVEATDGQAGASSAVPPVSDPLQMYQAAYLDYTKGDYELALAGFKDYITSFPDGEFAGNAQYWIGESLYSLGHYNESLIEFDKVLGNYPDSQKSSGAMLKKGFCFDAIGRKEDARAVYQKVIDTYPASDAARLAADRLRPSTRGQVPGR